MVQAKSDAAAMSLAAAKLAQAFVLPIELKPPGGPLETLVLAPTEPAPSAAGKYHVVIATDNLIYSRWQSLVRTVCTTCVHQHLYVFICTCV